MDGHKSGLAMTLNKQVKERFKVVNMIIDSTERDMNAYPSIHEFAIQLNEPFKDVLAIRLVRSEVTLADGAAAPTGAYISLNNYKLVFRNREQDEVSLFARIPPGYHDKPALQSADPFSDPFTHVLRPVEPKLTRFDVKVWNKDGTPFTDSTINVVLQLAVYMAAS
jgi:hypothetical protein